MKSNCKVNLLRVFLIFSTYFIYQRGMFLSLFFNVFMLHENVVLYSYFLANSSKDPDLAGIFL